MGSLRLYGDKENATSLIGEAKRLMYILKDHMKFNNLQQLSRSVTLSSGDIIFVQVMFGQELIEINAVPEAPIVAELIPADVFRIKIVRADGVIPNLNNISEYEEYEIPDEEQVAYRTPQSGWTYFYIYIVEAKTGNLVSSLTVLKTQPGTPGHEEGEFWVSPGKKNEDGETINYTDELADFVTCSEDGYWTVDWPKDYTDEQKEGDFYIDVYMSHAWETQYPNIYKPSEKNESENIVKVGNYEVAAPYLYLGPQTSESERADEETGIYTIEREVNSSVPYFINGQAYAWTDARYIITGRDEGPVIGSQHIFAAFTGDNGFDAKVSIDGVKMNDILCPIDSTTFEEADIESITFTSEEVEGGALITHAITVDAQNTPNIIFTIYDTSMTPFEYEGVFEKLIYPLNNETGWNHLSIQAEDQT